MRETRIVAYSPDDEGGVTVVGTTKELAKHIRVLSAIGYNKFKMVPNVDE